MWELCAPAIRSQVRQVVDYIARFDSGMSEDRLECITQLVAIWQGVRDDFPLRFQKLVFSHLEHALRGRTLGIDYADWQTFASSQNDYD